MKESILNILSQSRAHLTPYLKTFEALKDAGVETYAVCWQDKYEAVYYGCFGKVTQSELAGFVPIAISKNFSLDKVKKALKKHQNGETNYNEFLHDLSNAGVSHYKVNMCNRQICYFGIDEINSYTEYVPIL